MYDCLYLEIDHSVFKECDLSAFYKDAKETVHVNAPEPQQKEVDICMFVDSDHAGGKSLASQGVVS